MRLRSCPQIRSWNCDDETMVPVLPSCARSAHPSRMRHHRRWFGLSRAVEVARNQKAVGWSSSHVGVSCAVCPKDEIKTDAEDRNEAVPVNRCTSRPRWDSERLSLKCISCHTFSLPEDQGKPGCGIDWLPFYLSFLIKNKKSEWKKMRRQTKM